jgi:hypothetical protein
LHDFAVSCVDVLAARVLGRRGGRERGVVGECVRDGQVAGAGVKEIRGAPVYEGALLPDLGIVRWVGKWERGKDITHALALPVSITTVIGCALGAVPNVIFVVTRESAPNRNSIGM